LVSASLHAARSDAALAVPQQLPAQQPPPPPEGSQPALVRVVYDDAGIKPENRAAAQLLRNSGAFERTADWLNQRVALRYPIEVRITDNRPQGVEVPATEYDGRTIYWPAWWLTENHEVLTEYVAEVLRDRGVSSVIAHERFNADDLTILANQFILGHEFGHALIHQLVLPLTGLEEDSADGFALFSTLNGPDGSAPVLGAATLFDEMATRLGTLTLEAYSSDHAVVQQRTYNFLCYAAASDPSGLGAALVADGYLPTTRAMFCPLAWAQMNYGWWTTLEPYATTAFRAQLAQEREQARQSLQAEEQALRALLRGERE
jgi:hypothetical protein